MIHVAEHEAIATITLADCRMLSRHDRVFGLSVRDAVRDAADRDSVKAIVIRSTGSDFSPPVASVELAAAAASRKADGGSAWYNAYAAASGLYQTVCFCKKVVITVVQGRCTGAGSMLVLCSDLTVAAPDSSFESPFASLPEANLVLAALTMRLNRAKSWVLAQEALSADEAYHAGLVNRIVPADALAHEAERMARAVSRMPLDGLAMSKINVETCLDAQGVGQEFDMAGFYASAFQACHGEGKSELGS